MLPDRRFRGFDKEFWANVRSISERGGYTSRRTKQIKVYTISEVIEVLQALGLGTAHVYDDRNDRPTEIGIKLEQYFEYQAKVLNDDVEPRLMDADCARDSYNELRSRLNPTRPVPMNKQSGAKKAPAYLTGIVNMLIEANCEGLACDYDPKGLTTFTRGGAPLRTLARRIDGCFPGKVNPFAIWEIKEYYYTTTFGSRVADGVYETLLDGMELEELREHEGVDVQHLLVVDGHYTWWQLGRSYLCRLVDMLHMGYVDEILFGYEAIQRMPQIVKEWVQRYRMVQ